MPWWDPSREQRVWRRDLLGVPLSQLRRLVDSHFLRQNPKMRRWAKRRLWWHDNRRWVITTVLAVLGLFIAGLNLFSR
jgi:hypothetical protein